MDPKDKKDMIGSKTGYTEDMFWLHEDIACYTKFIATMVRLKLVSLRAGQILAANYGQKRFDMLRNGIYADGPSL